MSPVPFERRLGQLLAVAGLIFVAGATLYPESGGSNGFSLWCLVCGRRGGVDVILNVLLFIPLGLGLRLAGMPWKRAVACAAAVSLTVELLQIRFIPGRDASLSDLLTNTTGGLIGATLAARRRTLLAPDPRAAGRLVLGGGLFWLAILASSAWAFQPWAPPHSRLFGRWEPRLPDRPWFPGEVLSASLFGAPLPNAELPDGPAVRHRIREEGTFSLGAEVVPGPTHRRWSPIVALATRSDVLATLEEVGDDVVFKPPARTYHLRLRQPGLRLTGELPGPPGDPVRLAAAERDLVLRIEAVRGTEHRVRELALSPSFGWSLVLPFDYAFGPEVRWLTALWVGGLLLPLGYWARWARRGRDVGPGRPEAGETPAPPDARWLFVLVGIAVLGLGVIPWLGGFRPVHWSEWLAAATGAGAGWALARRATYLAGRCASPSTSGSCSS